MAQRMRISASAVSGSRPMIGGPSFKKGGWRVMIGGVAARPARRGRHGGVNTPDDTRWSQGNTVRLRPRWVFVW